jgi:nucleotide-binding universal stress UspA family protein
MSSSHPVDRTIQADLKAKSDQLSYLLAYDSSDHSHAAVSLLLDLPAHSGFHPERCQVTLLSVLPTQWIGTHEAMQAALDAEQERLSTAGYEVKTILRAGNPAATINAYADEHQANLIVIGAIGLRAALNILLGGVAQQVVEYSNRPVLVVRAPYTGLKKVMLVVDGSENSRKAMEYLAPTSKEGTHKRCAWLPLAAEVNLMHVLPPPFSDEATLRAWALGPEALYPAPVIPIDRSAVEAAEERNGELLLHDIAHELSLAGIRAKTILKRGDAANEIIRKIHEEHIDLVVCGSRGLSAVTGWLLGSVSRKLVHYSGCSVLIVK